MQSGLIPKPHDPRDLNHERQFGAVDLSLLPPMGLGRRPISIEDQGFTQFCTAYCTSTASEYIEGIDMSPEFQAATISELLGYPITEGAPARSAMQALRLFGSLPKDKAPFSLAADGVAVADWKRWPRELSEVAAKYQKAGWYDVLRGSQDYFDNIRTALFQAHQAGEQRVAMAFTQWFPSWNNARGVILRRGTGSFSWHAHLFIDWTIKDGELVLIEQNSYGTAFGDQGLSYWSREAVNQLAEDSRNEAYMLRDMSPETAKEAQWNLAVIIFDMLVKHDPLGAIKWFVHFVTQILNPTTQQPAPPTPEPPTPAPEPPQPSPAPIPDLLGVMCEAIQTQEGWYKGSRSWRNKNPGNLKWAGQAKATGKDDGGFAIFATVQDGMDALRRLIVNAAEGRSKVYRPTMTLLAFFEVYAPSEDHNDPKAYALYVAKRMQVDAGTFTLNKLVS